jgi:acyl-coenzyme A synthetase/AMP-(fatty) acid ligase
MRPTGDFVAIDTNGIITFMGRRDNQIKLYGKRVQLEEVQSVFESIEQVAAAKVVCSDAERHDERTILVAFIVLKLPIADRTQIVATANEILPKYMQPDEVLFIDVMPINVNGKVRIEHHISSNVK